MAESGTLAESTALSDEDLLHAGLLHRLAVLLPPLYRDTFQTMQPVAMRSAGLAFDAEGRVAWDRIWGSFCSLAMAGGPPHKGQLLMPAAAGAIHDEPDLYAEVTAEMMRGLQLAAGMRAIHGAPGWVRLRCANDTMADWMLRAITMENVAVRSCGSWLELPAGPRFRVDKEIKNVVTVAAKTAHYWREQMPRADRFAIAQLLAQLDSEQVLVTPRYASSPEDEPQRATRARLADRLWHSAGLRASGEARDGWFGVECGSVQNAVAMMQCVLVSNMLARREESALYVPLNSLLDPNGALVTRAVRRAQRCAAARRLPISLSTPSAAGG